MFVFWQKLLLNNFILTLSSDFEVNLHIVKTTTAIEFGSGVQMWASCALMDVIVFSYYHRCVFHSSPWKCYHLFETITICSNLLGIILHNSHLFLYQWSWNLGFGICVTYFSDHRWWSFCSFIKQLCAESLISLGI